MTTHTVWDRYHSRLWRAWSERFRSDLAEAYPQTNGVELYVHNWIVCGDDPAESERASRMISGAWQRWHRIDARFTREFDRVDHEQHHGPQFRPLWCDRCQAKPAVKAPRVSIRETRRHGGGFLVQSPASDWGSIFGVSIFAKTRANAEHIRGRLRARQEVTPADFQVDV